MSLASGLEGNAPSSTSNATAAGEKSAAGDQKVEFEAPPPDPNEGDKPPNKDSGKQDESKKAEEEQNPPSEESNKKKPAVFEWSPPDDSEGEGELPTQAGEEYEPV